MDLEQIRSIVEQSSQRELNITERIGELADALVDLRKL